MFPHKVQSLLTTFFLLSSICNAQNNVTVLNTNELIKYGGNAMDAPICKLSTNGNIIGAQSGCYLISPPCTESVTMGQGGSGAASFTFKGSAIYITSALNSLSPIYTINLDEESTEVDGVRPSGPYTCSTLFSKTGLDPSVEHNIHLSVKGPSPTRNQTFPDSDKHFVFSLISFIYTEGDTKSAAAALPNAAGMPRHHANIVQGVILAFVCLATGLW